jgi:hypothetical protein
MVVLVAVLLAVMLPLVLMELLILAVAVAVAVTLPLVVMVALESLLFLTQALLVVQAAQLLQPMDTPFIHLLLMGHSQHDTSRNYCKFSRNATAYYIH